MLSITRSPGEAIRIGDDIEITVIAIKGGGVRLGINAPREIPVHRDEVYRKIAEANAVAAQLSGDILTALTAIVPTPAALADGPVESASTVTSPDSETPGTSIKG